MDCYFHTAVPSVAVCRDCLKTICATCRDEYGLCPGCRLDQRIRATQSARAGLSGQVGPSHPPPPPPPAGPRAERPPQRRGSGELATVSYETRGLLALGYPLWPLAALALLDPTHSPPVRRQAMQAICLNFGTFGLWVGLSFIAHIPLLGLSAWPLLALLFPIWLVATVVYGFQVWNGDDVRVPLVSDWLDDRENRRQPQRV